MNRFFQKLKGPPEEWKAESLIKGIHRAKGSFRCILIRELSERRLAHSENCLVEHLSFPEPGVRRAAARGMGLLGSQNSMEYFLKREVCTTVKVELAAAWLRGGGDSRLAYEILRDHGDRTLNAHTGTRKPGTVLGQDPETLIKAVEGLLEGREQASQQLAAAPHSEQGRRALFVLAHQGHPEDLERLHQLLRTGGRRTEQATIAALGLHGDPRSISKLSALLSTMSVDPGRGFAHRRHSATALGRIGLREASPSLLKALKMEVVDHEGRPGAGLGIQYPVRTNLIWALGELQETRAIEPLVALLSDDSGSALGGFYLAAMDALVKIGEPCRTAVTRVAGAGLGPASINAAGVLEQLSPNQ